MPESCNGLLLVDPSLLEFSKWNCRWVKKKAGRQPSDKPKKKSKPKLNRATIKKPKSICLVLEKEHLDFIKSQALQRSLSEGIPVEANQLIREALQRAFPIPGQLDMFGDPVKRKAQ